MPGVLAGARWGAAAFYDASRGPAAAPPAPSLSAAFVASRALAPRSFPRPLHLSSRAATSIRKDQPDERPIGFKTEARLSSFHGPVV